MKRKVVILLITLGLLLLAVPIIQNGIRYKMDPLTALSVYIMDGTEWSPNYSYRKFQSINIGMTTNDVLRILGPCLATTTYKDITQWHYTRGRDGGVMSSSSYSTHWRVIHFDTNGVVTGKVYTFYFD